MPEPMARCWRNDDVTDRLCDEALYPAFTSTRQLGGKRPAVLPLRECSERGLSLGAVLR
jgi:hypothetical protein